MDDLSPEKRLEVEKRLDHLAREKGQTPEQRLEFLTGKEDRTAEEQMELLLRVSLQFDKRAEELNIELQEKLKTSDDPWRTVEEFAQEQGMKRTNRPFPQGET